MRRINNLVEFNLELGDITDSEKLNRYKIDAIVNAARPTLMDGNDNSVDGRIHRVIDERLAFENQTFNDMIRKEIDGDVCKPETTIRCKRGRAVITEGYGLCPYIIHAVGTKYSQRIKIKMVGEGCCPSSAVQGLESCYREIVNILKQHSDIRNIAVPLIGSGNYGYPKEYALRIAIGSLYNAILEWYQKDPEIFMMENNRESENTAYIKIYIYLYDSDIETRELVNLEKSFHLFDEYIRNGRRISYQSSVVTQFQYLADILQNDGNHGYFTIAKVFRILLLLFRLSLFMFLVIKDKIGKNDWLKRRYAVEGIVVIKAVSGVLFWLIAENIQCVYIQEVCLFLSVIFLVDTVTYLLTSVLLSDIQRPSGNIIRSLILLYVNFMETQTDLSFIIYCWYRLKGCALDFYDALLFVFVGQTIEEACIDNFQVFLYIDECLEFLFITFAFAFFLNHVRPKKFLY